MPDAVIRELITDNGVAAFIYQPLDY